MNFWYAGYSTKRRFSYKCFDNVWVGSEVEQTIWIKCGMTLKRQNRIFYTAIILSIAHSAILQSLQIHFLGCGDSTQNISWYVNLTDVCLTPLKLISATLSKASYLFLSYINHTLSNPQYNSTPTLIKCQVSPIFTWSVSW